MKKTLFIMVLLSFLISLCYAGDVFVNGYYRKDGTYVRPHHRSSPDSDLSNNYGRANYQQRKQYQDYSTLPSYDNDYDNDGISNRYDRDDDDDGISDNYDSSQYGKKNSYFYTQPGNSYQYSAEQTQTVYSNGQAYQVTPQSDGSYIIKDSFGNAYRYDDENE